MKITAIYARSRNGIIGCDNSIPWHIPAEYNHFKNTTMGHALVMGRVTYESLPTQLKGRTIIVLTRNKSYSPKTDNTIITTNIEYAIKIAKDLGFKKLFICGGSEIYKLSYKYVDEIIESIVNDIIDGDTYMPKPYITKIGFDKTSTLTEKDFIINYYNTYQNGI